MAKIEFTLVGPGENGNAKLKAKAPKTRPCGLAYDFFTLEEVAIPLNQPTLIYTGVDLSKKPKGLEVCDASIDDENFYNIELDNNEADLADDKQIKFVFTWNKLFPRDEKLPKGWTIRNRDEKGRFIKAVLVIAAHTKIGGIAMCDKKSGKPVEVEVVVKEPKQPRKAKVAE